MPYQIISYCPDTHIEYDGETPEHTGVGGGITARIRMAKSLAKLGHEVEMVVNCTEDRHIDGVHYRPLESVDSLSGDVLILNTSGGDLDLSPALDIKVDTRLRIVWAHGVPKPGGLDELQPDFVYAVSNFIGDIIAKDWEIPSEKTFVSYNAFETDCYSKIDVSAIDRDPYRCIFFSHPSKGLNSALKLIKLLKKSDPRFHLEVYGSEALWGQEPQATQVEDGIRYFGLVGQTELSRSLLKSGFAIQLQTREEPGALAIVEAMQAGCIVIGSAVGCYPEYVEHGRDGFIYPGDPENPDLLSEVADNMLALARSEESAKYIRDNAVHIPWSSDVMANVWQSHWDWLTSRSSFALFQCRFCAGSSLLLEDGYHCTQCGKYSRSML